MIEEELKEKPKEKYSYPTLNLYSSSRVFNQRVSNHKVPLLKYRQLIRSNNCSRSHESDVVSSNLLRKLEERDGLIFSLKKMKKLGRMKVLICVCMYNEPKSAINLTLEGIFSNLPHLKNIGISPGDIAVVLIQDGILKLVDNRVKKTFVNGDKSMVEFYKQMDEAEQKDRCDLVERINIICNEIQNYERRGMSSNVARNKDFPPSIEKNVALVYQNTWHPNKTKSKNCEKFVVPTDPNECLKVFSCFKHSNGTKLSSHLWFFEGFCRFLKPEYCVLLDVGTTPDENGLANLISGFTSSRIGGVTGFMNVDLDFESLEEQKKNNNNPKQKESKFLSCIKSYIFSIERAQQYEYVISHFLDKNQESALGFLHVLPGAWSAYRYDALIKSDKYEPNLLERSYFKMMLNSNFTMKDFEEANMYLAEDRILSLGIYCQMEAKYILKYVPNAGARTDPMRDHENLMVQRRRWINSSFFAFLFVFKNYYYNVMDSEHNFWEKYINLNLSMVIALISTFNSYITPSIFFFVLYATIYQLPFEHSEIVAAVVCLLYSFVFLAAVAGSLTGKQWTKRAHIISNILSIFTFLLAGLVIYNIIVLYLKVGHDINPGNKTTMIVIVLLFLNAACSLFILLVHIWTHCKNVGSIIVNFFSYTFYSGAYSQTMVIHAFCNVDDVSWGTKGSASSGQNKYLTGKVFFVSSWLFYNALLTYIFIYVDIISRANDPSRPDLILLAIAIYGSAYLFLKTILAFFNHLIWWLCSCCSNKVPESRPSVIEFWEKEFKSWAAKDNKKKMEDSNVIKR